MSEILSQWEFFSLSFWLTNLEYIQSLIIIISIILGMVFILPNYLAAKKAAQAALQTAEISASADAWERFKVLMGDLRGDSRVGNKVASVLAIRAFLEKNSRVNALVMVSLENYIREVSFFSFEENLYIRADQPPLEVQAILELLVSQNSYVLDKKRKNNSLLSKLRLKKSSTWENNDNQWCMDLSRMDLRNVDLRGANLSDTKLYNSNINGANLHGAIIIGSDLRNAKLERAILSEADLSRSNLRGAKLCGASLIDANLSNTIMWDVDFTNAHLTRSDFSGAILGKAIFNNAQMQDTNFRGGNFLGTRFDITSLRNAKFRLSEMLTAEISLD